MTSAHPMSAPYAEVQPVLTIAIPTFNRAIFLDLCLRRICEELEALPIAQRASVAVFVSNNASTDQTLEIIKRYQSVAPESISFVCNSENIGADRNLLQCYKSAKTPYVWIFGDDDVILPARLRQVLDLLSGESLDILYLGGYSFTDDYLSAPSSGRRRRGLEVYDDALGFVRQTNMMLTFITSMIVRSDALIAAELKVVEGTSLVHLSWIFSLLRDGSRFLILRDRVWAAKIANSGGYGAVQVFGTNLSNIANAILVKQPLAAAAIKNSAIILWFPTYIMDLRRGSTHGFLQENVEQDLKTTFGKNWRYSVFLGPLLTLPQFALPAYFFFLRVIRKLFRFVVI